MKSYSSYDDISLEMMVRDSGPKGNLIKREICVRRGSSCFVLFWDGVLRRPKQPWTPAVAEGDFELLVFLPSSPKCLIIDVHITPIVFPRVFFLCGAVCAHAQSAIGTWRVKNNFLELILSFYCGTQGSNSVFCLFVLSFFFSGFHQVLLPVEISNQPKIFLL